MRLPIILAHGIAPFDRLYRSLLTAVFERLGLRSDRFTYFRKIASHLESHGFTVHSPQVGFAGAIDVRAQELARAVRRILDKSTADKVHVIAHSLGGLDTRHMIVKHGMERAVATVTTLGTPHLGTILADLAFEEDSANGIARGRFAHLGIHRGGDILRTLEALGIDDFAGFRDLRTSQCRDFNTEAAPREASNAVDYVTWSSHQDLARVFGPLKIPAAILTELEGENDGLGAASSHAWAGKVEGNGAEKTIEQHKVPFGADHLNQLGWWDLDELANTGFFPLGLRSRIRRFEQRVGALYLQMARHAEELATARAAL